MLVFLKYRLLEQVCLACLFSLIFHIWEYLYILLPYLQLRPNFCDAWSNLASAYMRKGRLTEAAQCCRQALTLNPRLVNPGFVLGLLFTFLGFRFLEVIISHFPPCWQVDAHSNLGNLMKAQGLVQEVSHCLSYLFMYMP